VSSSDLGENRIVLMPALNITEAELKKGVAIIKRNYYSP
jgi:hypothetical protein